MTTHDQTSPGRRASVREDWCAWLPEQKARVYESVTQHLEAAYTMLSVSLNEALELRHGGETAKALQAVCVTPALCTRLTEPLAALLRALSEHAKHYGTVPNAAPLEASNFQGSRGQRSARMSALLSRVLLSHRAQFLHKLSTLHEMVTDLGREFSDAESELTLCPADDLDPFWQVLDGCHFDLNTCLREAVVLFKSFLVAVPLQQLGIFEGTHRVQLCGGSHRGESRTRLIRHRRMAQIAGE